MPIKIAPSQGSIITNVTSMQVAAVQGTFNKNINTGQVAPTQGVIDKEFYNADGWIYKTGLILNPSSYEDGTIPPLKYLSSEYSTKIIKPKVVTIGTQVTAGGSPATVRLELCYLTAGDTWYSIDYKEEYVPGSTTEVISKTFNISGVETRGLKYIYTCSVGWVDYTYRTGRCTAWYEQA